MKILDIPRSGSYAGLTSSHNRAGQFVRNRRKPTNSPSVRRSFIRAAMAHASSGYSSLTDSLRAAWSAAADAHPVTDRLGSMIKLTGHQLFVSINTMLRNCSVATVIAPPSDFSVYSQSGAALSFSLVTGAAFSLLGAGLASDFVLVSLSQPLPAGRSFPGRISQLQVQPGNQIHFTITTAIYAARFGTPAIGQKVFARLTPVNSKGVRGVPVTISAIVAA
jgi:hypothetical protein